MSEATGQRVSGGAARVTRPSRAELEPAVLAVIARHGALILRSARRYSFTHEDAEDAYQRGLEILLTKAPSVSEAELVPWLRTVVKHEALAIRRHRQRATPTEEETIEGVASGNAAPAVTHEQAERLERLRVGAEAMGRIKPQEMRCLLLLAEGYSYRQICDETGFTYTKVNRCITEGRRSFLDRVASIESGAECERYRPLLSALADGEAAAADVTTLRPHLRSCLACRATLREYRQAPVQVAALAAPVALDAPGVLARGAEWLTAWAQDRWALVGLKVQTAAEAAAAHAGGGKAAAVAATTAALAGGTAAGVGTTDQVDRAYQRAELSPAFVPSDAERRQARRTRAASKRSSTRRGPARKAVRRTRPAEPRSRAAVATAARAPARVAAAPVRAPSPAPAPTRYTAPAPTAAPAPARKAPARRDSAGDDQGEFGL